MAQGDITVFNTAKEWLMDGTFDLDGDTVKMAICDNTTTPTATTATPALGDFTQVDAVGDYSSGGSTLTCTWVESGGTVTFATSTTVSVSSNASHTKDAFWGIIYADNVASPVADAAIAFVQLSTGSGVDLATTDLTVNSGTIFTLA